MYISSDMPHFVKKFVNALKSSSNVKENTNLIDNN